MVPRKVEPEEPSLDEIALHKVLYALSDPVRLEIVLKLAAASEIACGAFGLSMPKSSLSHHFKVLRSTGILATRREGKEWVNSLRREDLETLFPGLLESVIAAANTGLEDGAGCE